MEGKENIQKRVLNINPYDMLCNDHILNVLVNEAVRCCVEATTTFQFGSRDFFTLTQSWKIQASLTSDFIVKPLSDGRGGSML